MNKQEILETIDNCNSRVASLRASVAEARAKGSDLAEDSKLQLIGELLYAIELFNKDLDKRGA